MLKLLLDEHLSPRLAEQFRTRWPRARIESVLFWNLGRFAGVPDEVLLAAACAEQWTLVTYDLATIVPLLKNWGEQGIDHGGIILVDDRTIASNDFGGLLRALGLLWNAGKDRDWKNVVVYLSRHS